MPPSSTRAGGRIPPRMAAAVGVGGTVGTLVRVGVGELTDTTAAATLIVNLTGAALLGLLVGWAPFTREPRRSGSPAVYAFFGTGLLGGFTTYSALALEVATLPGWTGAGYGLLTVTAGVAIAVLAILGGRKLRTTGRGSS